MNASERRKWRAIGHYLECYQALFGYHRWEIAAFATSPNVESTAEAHVDPEYHKAILHFTLSEINEEDCHRFARHEFFHIPLWRLSSLAYELAGDDPFKREQVRKAMEEAVTTLEELPHWDAVVPPPEDDAQ